MAETAVAGAVRVLCLGNDLIADDALGPEVARRLRIGSPAVDVVESSLTGLGLLEGIVGAERLVVVDSVVTGSAPPGTVRVLHETDFDVPRGGSPHYIGLFEALDLGRALRLPVPDDVTLVAVEAGDLSTVGGGLSAEVEAAVPDVVALVRSLTS
jgi:hydrogenase maturation protease